MVQAVIGSEAERGAKVKVAVKGHKGGGERARVEQGMQTGRVGEQAMECRSQEPCRSLSIVRLLERDSAGTGHVKSSARGRERVAGETNRQATSSKSRQCASCGGPPQVVCSSEYSIDNTARGCDGKVLISASHLWN